ncbi:uncharacterized protein EKO05_0002281 [Ascochyta rabiei]|uniref:uncharacterized protein n=1 Tax=Didymella rabiei TaxID=5454 RepID=UPI0022082D4F|nr:uncharacterized protein EKO05_0002281 [Ascochyta rabiei]UPX11687.1 hypothetical protein EKO05_0002281 [Ascochyta rabiei]
MIRPSHGQHASALHDSMRRQSHRDSEEAVQIERQRIARELQPFERHGLSIATSHVFSEHQDAPIRARQTSHRNSAASNAPLQDRESLESYTTTQPDAPRSISSSFREKHWYSVIVEFWTTHVSLTIDEGAHRDHLGMKAPRLQPKNTILTSSSTRAYVSRLPADFPYSRYDRCDDCAALSYSARGEPGSQDRFLCHRRTTQRGFHRYGDICASGWSDAVLETARCLGKREGACRWMGGVCDHGHERSSSACNIRSYIGCQHR